MHEITSLKRAGENTLKRAEENTLTKTTLEMSGDY